MTTVSCNACECQTPGDVTLNLTCDTCRSRFHSICVSVDENLVQTLTNYRGFFWRCNDCYENDVNALRFKKILTIMENMSTSCFVPTIASNLSVPLDNAAATLDNDAMEVGDITIVPSKTPQTKRARSATPNIGRYVVGDAKKKRLDFNQPDPDAVLPSTSKAMPSLPAPTTVDRTDEQETATDEFDIGQCIIKKCDRYFHLSQFHPDTKADSIKSYAVKKLNCEPENITCQKLVSVKRDNQRPLTFVSFKIGTTKKLAKKIMDKNIWPKDVTIKQFEDHSKNGKAAPSLKNVRSRSRSQHHPLQTAVTCQHNHHNQRQRTRLNNPLQQHPMTCDGQQHGFRAPTGQRQRQQQTALTWRVSQK